MTHTKAIKHKACKLATSTVSNVQCLNQRFLDGVFVQLGLLSKRAV